jgi:sec-independent protein translocase protein TatC
MDEDPQDLAFWEHVAALRKTLLRSLFAILTATILCFAFYQELFSLMAFPLQENWISSKYNSLTINEIRYTRVVNSQLTPLDYTLPEGSSLIKSSPGVRLREGRRYQIPPGESLDIEIANDPQQLIILGPLEGLSVTFKFCFWAGFVLSSPLWIYWLIQFISPALTEGEWRMFVPFLGLSFVFLSCGALFAYFFTIPVAAQYLQSFNSSLGNNLWSVGHYLDFTLFLLFANALAFELSLILFFLVHYGVISRETLAAKRRFAYVLAFILGALLTPPDVFTQILMAGLLIGLYELILIYAKLSKKKPIT